MSDHKNAIIKSTHLGREDHAIMTFMIHLDYGGSGQGFGGYVLGGPFGIKAIERVLEITGVDRWEKLPGCPVRVVASHNKVERIGHFLNDDWLDLDALARECGK